MATGLPLLEVERAVSQLVRQKAVCRIQLPSGHLGYRLVAHQAVPSRPATAPVKAQVDSSELEFMAEFLARSGTPCAITPSGRLRVGEEELRPPAVALANGEARSRWLDAVVAEHLSDALTRSARTHLLALHPRLRLNVAESHDVVDPAGRCVATIAATRTTLPTSEPVMGNFLAPGEHWGRLAALLSSEDDVPLVRVALHRALPAGTANQLRDDAIAATRRLRADRTLAFAHDVRVDVGAVSILFSPVAGVPGALVAPFVMTRAGVEFAGGLGLDTPGPVMPCQWRQRSDRDTLAFAWSLALVTYAELTCVAVSDGSRAASSRRPRQGGRRSAALLALRQPRGGSSGASRMPADFVARGDTSRFLASYVAGHRRRLQPGQHHSLEAVRHAVAVGITLRSGETWVQPHTRGVPVSAVLHFSWRGPRWAHERPAR